MRAAVLLPVKSFAAAKARLGAGSGGLSAAERERLARETATLVVEAANGLPVFVVCDDPAVAGWAVALHATPLHSPSRGLNPAVTEGVEQLAAIGFRTVVVAHADLPLADDLARFAHPIGVTIVPDRLDDGSNVLTVPAGVGFRFAYGPGSFRRHLAEAARLGLPARVVRDPLLGTDLDTPADLAHPLVRKALPWLPTNRVNPPSA